MIVQIEDTQTASSTFITYKKDFEQSKQYEDLEQYIKSKINKNIKILDRYYIEEKLQGEDLRARYTVYIKYKYPKRYEVE